MKGKKKRANNNIGYNLKRYVLSQSKLDLGHFSIGLLVVHVISILTTHAHTVSTRKRG